MATITLGELRVLARERADMETQSASTDFVDDAELDRRINEALSELRDLLDEVQGQEYFAKEYAFTTADSQKVYPLPEDFKFLLGVRADDGSDIRQLEEWHYQERGRLEDWGRYSTVQIWHLRYRLRGSSIVLLPIPQSANTVTVDYIPSFQKLDSESETFECPEGWWAWAVLVVAIALRTKEESDTADLRADLARWDKKIRKLGKARDMGRPPRIQDTRRDGGESLFGDFPYRWGRTI